MRRSSVSRTICVSPETSDVACAQTSFLVPPPAAKIVARLVPDLGIGLEHVLRAAGDALEERAVDVAARMGQVEAEEHALGLRIVDRRPLAREVGQHHQPVRARGRLLGLRRESRSPPPPDRARGQTARGTSGISVPLVARPAIEACWPGKSQGAYQSRASRTRSLRDSMMKMVEPYISIMSPGCVHPDAQRLGARHRSCRR